MDFPIYIYISRQRESGQNSAGHLPALMESMANIVYALDDINVCACCRLTRCFVFQIQNQIQSKIIKSHMLVVYRIDMRVTP